MKDFDEQNKLISIITPSLNSERYIGEAIQSVINQSYPYWELLIVDGGSSDKTIDIIEKFSMSDSRIKLIHNKNDNGTSQARSEGIKKANGEFIAFIDSDDIWHNEKLKIQIEFLKKNNYLFCFTRYKKLYSNGMLSHASIGGHKSNTYSQYLRRRGIANSTVMIHRSCMKEHILNTIGKSHGEDTLWWLLILKDGNVAYSIEKPLTYYRIVDGSLSSKVLNNQFTVWHSYRNELKLSIITAALYYFGYLIDVFIRRILFHIRNNIHINK